MDGLGEKFMDDSKALSLIQQAYKNQLTLHGLEYSYAMHGLKNKTDGRFMQETLGHNSSRTTEIYTYVSTKRIQQIKSPFDDL